jgi:pSer/pThr/pTyr-binding forkhead associated (FHA) protein
MAYFQLGGQEFTLKAGTQRIGPEEGADLRLPSGDATATATVVQSEQGVIIQRGSDAAVVKVNGVQLGAEPSPLIHGDRVEIGGHELRFGDLRQTGSTMFVSSAAIAEAVRSRASAPSKPTMATGGRLVSLVDGREYAVPNTGLVIGRDPSADVVVAATEVSRKHVSIGPAAQGYVLTDLSTNGVWVNGTRVAKEQVLGRGDVIRIATEEFRFYADVAKDAPAAASAASASAASAPAASAPAASAPAASAPAASAPAAASPPAPASVAPAAPAPAPTAPAPVPTAPAPVAPVAPVAPAPPVPAPAAPAPPPPAPTPPPRPPAPPAAPPPPPAPPIATPKPAPPPPAAKPAQTRPQAPRPVLAILEYINEGPDKGKTVEVYGPLTNIGRGAHNDFVIASESVSDSHAKLQKRESGWFVVDIDSTNGTYVGGRRVRGEQALTGAPDLRFGDVKVAFRPLVQSTESDKGTRAIAGVSVEEARRMAARKSGIPLPPPSPVPVPAPPPSGGGTGLWIGVIVGIAIVAAIVWFLFLRGS